MAIYDTRTARLDRWMEVWEMKIKVNKTIKIEDGKHTGRITAIEYKTEPYEYVDFMVEESVTKFIIKCGVPSYISENSALGMILSNFGAPLSKLIDKDIEIEDFINVGASVSFNTKTDGKFSKIIPQSIFPR